ncbi:maleylpyruvate isomerase N-terminal domain-containing protein [Angustibacter luteus]|uniref:Maleylpyruvate isomerase N-terminal domain-containing protein n=1 Tax=Angustibacter luteus TaxID=658456 RepID=A0ABW1JHQ8_9ACTN
MSTWNAMSYEGKDTILRVVRTEAEHFFALAEAPGAWERTTPCDGWTSRDLVAHIIDTTEGYFKAFDAARGTGDAVPAPHGLPAMAGKVNEAATAFRGTPQTEMMDRLRADFEKMQGILEAVGEDDWTGFLVTHPYMGPVPAFFYAAGQLMDYGVHSWDIRQGSGAAHGLHGDAADLLVPFMFEIWRGTVKSDQVSEPFTIGIRVTGRNAGDYRVTVGPDGLSYETGELESLPAYLEFDAGSLVLTAFGRSNSGTVRGDLALAEQYLNLFFRI